MADTIEGVDKPELSRLFDELAKLRTEVAEAGAARLAEITDGALLPLQHRTSLLNFCEYLALRQHDVRPMQRRLMSLGLSSVGRLESRVLPTIDAVLASLAAIIATSSLYTRPSQDEFFRGEEMLSMAAEELLGPSREHRRGRIMVTLPGDVADRPEFAMDLATRGMDVARINCAHDGPEAWTAMAAHVRAAGDAVGRRLTVLMDIAGPKIRTEAIASNKKAKIQTGDLLRLVASKEPFLTDDVSFCASVSLPEIVNRVKAGNVIRYDDGKLEGTVEGVDDGEVLVRVTHTKSGGAKLKPEKGLNLPDTDLGLSPLTSKDHSDLAIIAANADMLGYSFVTRPEDIDLLEDALANYPIRERPLGLIAKIEQPDAVANLPALIARARCLNRPFGVMIARGDLAAEIGFERVAEMQEELLWICEAAAVPTIWATQVLEDLVKHGIPSRGEMTDAAMAARSECVMLNKGPEVSEAVTLLDSLLGRMEGHLFKKTPALRPLHSW